MKIERFEEIKSWQLTRELVKSVYEITGKEKFAKDFGLRDQIRRASVSVMANIAEGFVSQSNPTFIKFLFISLASAGEVQSHLYVALDQKYILRSDFDKIFEQCTSTARHINGFIKYLLSHQRATKRALN